MCNAHVYQVALCPGECNSAFLNNFSESCYFSHMMLMMVKWKESMAPCGPCAATVAQPPRPKEFSSGLSVSHNRNFLPIFAPEKKDTQPAEKKISISDSTSLFFSSIRINNQHPFSSQMTSKLSSFFQAITECTYLLFSILSRAVGMGALLQHWV